MCHLSIFLLLFTFQLGILELPLICAVFATIAYNSEGTFCNLQTVHLTLMCVVMCITSVSYLASHIVCILSHIVYILE